MKERIILAPGLNGNELTKNLALHGVNCFNTKVVGAGELARIALMQSGITVEEEYLDKNEEMAIVAEAIKGIEYFGNTSFSDIGSIVSAIQKIRGFIPDLDEASVIKERLTSSEVIFTEKNAALLAVYERYMQALKDKNSIDSVLLIRKAIAECSAVSAEFVTLEEYPLNPLQNALLQKISGGNVTQTSIDALYGVSDAPIKIAGYKNCYGASNEVETVLADIYAGKKCDECTVVLTDFVTYGQLFLDYALLYDIPMTFGSGIPIINSNPAKLLFLYYNWRTNGFYGAGAVKDILSSDAFDRSKLDEVLPEAQEGFSWNTFYEVLGQIRFTDNEDSNKERLEKFKTALSEDIDLVDKNDLKACKFVHLKELCIPYLDVMAKVFALDPVEFIKKYSRIRVDNPLLFKLDTAAVKEIEDQLKTIYKVDPNQSLDDVIPAVLKTSVLSQQNAPGKIHITTVDRAVTSVRKNVYILGMSSTKFPGSPREDYLLLDDDLRLFGEPAERYTSSARIRNKMNRLIDLIRLASKLGSKIQISYSGLNVSELKKENASSMIYELFKEEHGSDVTSEQLDKQITKVEYFEPNISIGRYIGKEYVDWNFIITHNRDTDEPWPEQTLDREWSPSALDVFMNCERAFFLRHIVGLPQPDEDDPFEIISARDEGTMAHSLMELLADSPMDKEEFIKTSGEYFDRYIDEHPPLIVKNVENKRHQFLEMMELAFDNDPHREVLLKEEDIHCTHETSGIKIHGFPDRVEKLDDGTCLIVDYKTGNRVKHQPDDPQSCLQVLIYAYLMEQKGFKVSKCEYRYIRLGQKVECAWNEDTKNGLHNVLMGFKGSMLGGDFHLATDIPITDPDAEDPCMFCKYSSVCGRRNF